MTAKLGLTHGGRIVGLDAAVVASAGAYPAIGGVLLILSYLVVPAVCAAFLVDSMKARFALGWTIATVCSVVSLYLTGEVVDLPIGAAIVCVLGIALLLAAVGSRFRRRGPAPAPELKQFEAREP